MCMCMCMCMYIWKSVIIRNPNDGGPSPTNPMAMVTAEDWMTKRLLEPDLRRDKKGRPVPFSRG